MISTEQLEEKVRKLSRRVDIDPPKVRVLASSRRSLAVKFGISTLTIDPYFLEALTDNEADFALALSFARRMRHRYWLVAIWILPILFFGLCAGLLVNSFQEQLTGQFWSGFAIMFSGCLIGYIMSEILSAWYCKRHRDQVFHEAMILTGNATAAESYLIRLQAESGQEKMRKRLSSRKKDELETQLKALEYACLKLGLNYRSVVHRIS